MRTWIAPSRHNPATLLHHYCRRLAARAALGLLALVCAGCAAVGGAGDSLQQGILRPAGEGAQRISDVWWFMFAVGGIIYVIVMIALVGALLRRRNSEADVHAPETRGSRMFVLISGAAIPAVILVVLFILTLQTMSGLAQPARNDSLTIEVIGRQWWWEVRYPGYGFTTANEIHIPAGQPVQLRLTSADVIHSFWVPELHGKIDLLPGQTNSITLEADSAGAYRGQCAEFCGIQHTKMALYVIAENAGDFALWAEGQQQPAPRPADPVAQDGLQIFLGSSCVYCHTIRGTNANSNFGPDLTHIASRRTLGAGAAPNTRGHLAGWIIDSQSIKPGNKMPPMYLSSVELQALLAYMDTLQ